MYYRIIVAVALLFIGAREIRAQNLGGLLDGTGQGLVGEVGVDSDSATLEALLELADRVTVGEVGAMHRVIEDQVVQTKDGEQITGKFIFTYVDLTPSEHIVGDAVGTVMVRLLGGLHPDGTKFTTYADAPSISSEEKGQRTVTANDQDGYEYIYVGSNSVRSLFGGDGQSSKIVVGDDPKESGVTQASVFPNPFNPEVTLTFGLEHSASVGVRIYNELGQQVRVLAKEGRAPGGFLPIRLGRSRSSRPVPSIGYVYSGAFG